jgi:peptide deformylase
MAIRNIVTVGDPILRKQCRPVGEVTDRTRVLIDDMIETMHAANGVGLAAPQVGIMRRLFVAMPDPEEGSVVVMVDPEIISLEGNQECEEGCLSVPSESLTDAQKACEVVRSEWVIVSYTDAQTLQTVQDTVKGYTARIFQHETDHLEGILYTDRL